MLQMYHSVKKLFSHLSFVSVNQKLHPRWPPELKKLNFQPNLILFHVFNIISGVEEEYTTNEHN